ncbi:transglutaminase-like domain-containing protein [Pseudidiomarina sediminum]|uniref:transglutaminase-like domain-containing protein n=1 Tax=Pseudidiomarina sediminum TaxID=431675 RepID=UPI001C987667|nr:transglutaminase domain-containing protein [Pseudidiomarina sediminum]MBY6064167.1 transglutaminase domain-containing protein [Pseudidiomarina sediminum]
MRPLLHPVLLAMLAGSALIGCSSEPQSAPQDNAEQISETERKARMRRDFQWTEARVKEKLAELIPDYTEADFERWDAAGLLEYQIIDGEKRYFNRAVSNLFYIDDAARDRRIEPKSWYYSIAPLYQVHPHHQAVMNNENTSKRIRITYELTVKPDVIPAEQTLRVWLPFPRAIPGQQTDIQLLSASPTDPLIANEQQLQRTAYFEQQTKAGEPTAFSISYEYTAHAIHNRIDAAQVTPLKDPAALAPYLGERAPHMVFNETLQALNERIVGDETNLYRIAQKLFAAVDDIPWASAREYSSIANISEYAATAGHADCGQQTLLLMTLMRMNGIPTRWQSGWEFSDGKFNTMHDWGWFYLEPYGWMPMDVTHGQLNTMDDALRWFYLGSLDAYRLTFNDDFSQPFFPAKQHTRSETVDSQRGEVEWELGNLYFDKWNYKMTWEVIE